MANIRIDPDTMDVRANEYRAEAEQIGQVINKMDGLLNQLQGEWEGEASRAYYDRYMSDLRPNFVRTQDLANEIAAALNQTAMLMREQDTSIAASLRGNSAPRGINNMKAAGSTLSGSFSSGGGGTF